MSKDVIAFEPNQLPAELADKFGVDAADDLISGGGAYPVVSIKGKVWTIKVEGEKIPLINNDTGDPIQSLEVVIVRSTEGLSKNYYIETYSEGDEDSPDCFSHDGVVPDSAAETPQCTSCAACPHNKWGSKISDNGSKGKACSESKILAITFTGDMENESLGGPMMLRVPPASLKDLSTFARGMKSKGFVPQQISIRIGFDIEAAFPKLTFKAVRPLKGEEVQVVSELFDSDQVAEILHIPTTPGGKPMAGGGTAAAPKQETKTVDTDFEEAGEEAVVPSIAPEKPKKAPPKKKAAPKAKPAEDVVEGELVEEPQTVEDSPANAAAGGDIDSDIDDILGDLDDI